MDISKIKGIIFDYGGTIDSNGKHWAEVIWDAYKNTQVPIDKKIFREAYVYAERYLATHPVIQPEDTFKDLLVKKINIQMKWLEENGFLPVSEKTCNYSLAISNQCYTFARSSVQKAKPIIEKLSERYPLVLVSNFYGNIESVLDDFGITHFFNQIVESAVVGVRKPDPAIFALGVKVFNLPADNVVVIGDSYKKDIVPARSLGCSGIWIKGPAWEEETTVSEADAVIYDFSELKNIFQL